MPDYNTPGVYIEEQNAFPNSIAQVETAIPAFIGYTQKAERSGNSLTYIPTRITSFTEYISLFGGTAEPEFELMEWQSGSSTEKDFNYLRQDYTLQSTSVKYRLFSGIKLFYANGGGTCYIVSVGSYKDVRTKTLTDIKPFEKALNTLKKELEPTMVVIPDLIEFVSSNQTTINEKYAQGYTLQNQMIEHCGKMMSRVAILDIPGGFKEPVNRPQESVKSFRSQIDSSHLSYAAAYYPWVHTSIYQRSEISYRHLDQNSFSVIEVILKKEFAKASNVHQQAVIEAIDTLSSISVSWSKLSNEEKDTLEKAHQLLLNMSKGYQLIIDTILSKLNLMGPSSALAGIYTSVDNSRGVWKAPANVSVSSVIKPAINITQAEQDALNAPVNGKSVCAIRSFIGRGNLVWGARTLDGNSNEFRYVNVRRTIIMIEQSIKNGIGAFVFEPNDANTWVTVKSMITNFLEGLWSQGALAGSTPQSAFGVQVGLGSTMTANDILEGIMIVQVNIAFVRPAEFIILTFQQKMQET